MSKPDQASSLDIAAAGPAALFAALGDQTRLTLVERLSAKGDRQSISRLGTGLPMSRQAIRKHLTILEEVGLVDATSQGREQCFALRREPIVQARACLDGIARQWEDLLLRLKTEAEKGE